MLWTVGDFLGLTERNASDLQRADAEASEPILAQIERAVLAACAELGIEDEKELYLDQSLLAEKPGSAFDMQVDLLRRMYGKRFGPLAARIPCEMAS